MYSKIMSIGFTSSIFSLIISTLMLFGMLFILVFSLYFKVPSMVEFFNFILSLINLTSPSILLSFSSILEAYTVILRLMLPFILTLLAKMNTSRPNLASSFMVTLLPRIRVSFVTSPFISVLFPRIICYSLSPFVST